MHYSELLLLLGHFHFFWASSAQTTANALRGSPRGDGAGRLSRGRPRTLRAPLEKAQIEAAAAAAWGAEAEGAWHGCPHASLRGLDALAASPACSRRVRGRACTPTAQPGASGSPGGGGGSAPHSRPCCTVLTPILLVSLSPFSGPLATRLLSLAQLLNAPGAWLPARPSCLPTALRCQLPGAGLQVRTLLHLTPLPHSLSCSTTHPPVMLLFSSLPRPGTTQAPGHSPPNALMATLNRSMPSIAQSLNRSIAQCPSCTPPPTTS